LPGLFGSSMPETYALKRLIGFLRTILNDEDPREFQLPVELMRLLCRVMKANRRYQSQISENRDFIYWDEVSTAREIYRSSICLGLDGAEESLGFAEVKKVLGIFENKLDVGIQRALKINNNFPPTYFSFDIVEYKLIKDRKGNPLQDANGRPYIHAERFLPMPLPLFLEGFVRAMKGSGADSAKHLYQQVKESQLFDLKLKMYKVNAPLTDSPNDIGRARAFTPGWLENESIWLHMEYKYLFEVLRAGLYKEFFQDFKNALIPFLDPNRYGRSILENSSFLVSSVHPDDSLHGAGFVARLSGATAEFLSMWKYMMAGEKPYFVQNGQLYLNLKPVLPKWLFCEDDSLSFIFLGKTIIIYHNPRRYDTYDENCVIDYYILHPVDSSNFKIESILIPPPYSVLVRDGKVNRIDVYFK